MEKKQFVIKRILQIIFAVSVPFFTLLEVHSAWKELGHIISIVIAFGIGIAISGKVVGCFREHFKWSYALISGISAAYIAYTYAWQGNGVSILQQHPKVMALLPAWTSSKHLAAGLILASFPAIFLLIHFVLVNAMPYVKSFFLSLDKFEKTYLLAIFVLAVTAVSVFFLQTSASYRAVWNGNLQAYDIIYTTDSTEIYITDSFFKILSGPNDIRQPLFGLFALPAALIGKAVAAVLFFVPDAYAIAIGVIQILLLAVTVIMLMRLLKIEAKERIWFVLLVSSTYTYLLYSFLIEQYVIAYFYVILVLYVYKKSDKLNFAYFGAVSTLLTSGILFPLITKEKKAVNWIRDMLKCLVVYFGIVTICGQLPQFLDIRHKITLLMTFSGEEVTWMDKWIQFTHFFKSMFWAPEAEILNVNYMSYRVVEHSTVSYIGIAILIAALAGFWVSRKEWISRVAGLWVLFSGMLLFVVGWGTAENGLILYALYFAWAYIILLYQLIRTVIRRQCLQNGVIGAAALLLLVRNVYEIIQIYQFGITYYPVM